MKKYLVIGNPIEHSLSPLLHNFWIDKYNISAIYKKIELKKNNIKKILSDLRDDKINGINVNLFIEINNYVKSCVDFINYEIKGETEKYFQTFY